MTNSSIRNKNARLRTKTLLNTLGMSQKRFSESIGYSDTTISTWLSGKLDISDKGLFLIEHFLDKYDSMLAQLQE